jgi:hypothetical protein
MNKQFGRGRNNTKTSKLIDALAKDQRRRCSDMGSNDSRSSFASSCSMDSFGALPDEDSQDKAIPLSPSSCRGTLSDSDQNFLEGLLVLAPNNMDAIRDLLSPCADPFLPGQFVRSKKSARDYCVVLTTQPDNKSSRHSIQSLVSVISTSLLSSSGSSITTLSG